MCTGIFLFAAVVGAGHARPGAYPTLPFYVLHVGEGFIPPGNAANAANLPGRVKTLPYEPTFTAAL